MHLTKPTLLLLALTISAGCVSATPHPGLLEGLWDELGKTGQTIVSGLVEATKNGSAIAEDLAGSLKNSTSKFVEQTAQFADQIASALHAAVSQGLQDFAAALRANIAGLKDAIARVSSRVKRQALKDALAGLQGINASVSDLEIALQNITDQLEQKKEQYGAEVQRTWNNWAAAQLERVDQETNGVGVEEAQEILDELENRYAGYLHSCLEEQQVRLATYEQEVHTTVARYQNATNDLIAQIEICQQSKSGPISCRIAIKKALKAIQSAPRDLLNLRLKGLKLLAINLDEAGCVGQTLAEHALERPSVERQLDEIIRRYQEQNAGEDDSGSDEASASGSASGSEEGSNSSSEEEASSESNESSEEEASSESNESSEEEASSESNESSEEEASSESNESSEEEASSESNESSGEEASSESNESSEEEASTSA